MAKAPIIGGFSADEDARNTNERSINIMPEKSTGKTDYRLITTPALTLFAALPEQPIKGCFEASNGRAFVVAGYGLYEIFYDGTFNRLGATNGGRASIDDNGFDLTIVDGFGGWTFTFETNTYAPITSNGFFPSPVVVVYDGYSIIFKEGTQEFAISELYNAKNYDPTEVGAAESNPDPIQTIISDSTGLCILGTKTIEFYWNSGDLNNTFQRRGSPLKYGCVAPRSTANIDDGVVWVGRDANGQGTVYRVSGAVPRIISTPQITGAIRELPNLAEATALVYQQNDHAFYALNVPGMPTTFVYDFSTDIWHERRSYNTADEWDRWRVEFHMMAFGKNLGVDYENGNVYVISGQGGFDNDKIRRYERTLTPFIDQNSYRSGTYDSFKLDADVGYGEFNPPYNSPQIALTVSNDGGKTFGSERCKPIGKTGEFKTTVNWRRCGSSPNRVFRVAMAGPYPLVINNAFVDASLST